MIRRCPKCNVKNRVPNDRLHNQPACGKCGETIGFVDKPVPMGSAEEFDALIKSASLPVLVDFWASWCGPCRAVAPELEKLAISHAGKVIIAKVDTEALPGVSGRFGISGIPTMILFDGGKEAKRVSGAMPAAQIAQRVGL